MVIVIIIKLSLVGSHVWGPITGIPIPLTMITGGNGGLIGIEDSKKWPSGRRISQ